MKKPALIALALSLLSTTALLADNGDGSTVLISNHHGGYNVARAEVLKNGSIAFFGAHGYAAAAAAEAKLPPKFVMKPAVQDDGHGNKHTVYHKVYYATAEEAAQAKLQQ